MCNAFMCVVPSLVVGVVKCHMREICEVSWNVFEEFEGENTKRRCASHELLFSFKRTLDLGSKVMIESNEIQLKWINNKLGRGMFLLHIHDTLNSPLNVCRCKVEIVNMGRFSCLVRLERMWAQDPKCSPQIFLETRVGTNKKIISSTRIT